jgi:predicted nucleic acid-binding protein
VRLILDTNVLFAGLDRDDKNHRACRELLDNPNLERVVPATVLVELDYFIRDRLGPLAYAGFLRDITDGSVTIVELRRDDYIRVRDICAKYADADIGLVDASIVAIAERLNEPKIATLDWRHFGLIRPRHVDALELLPH